MYFAGTQAMVTGEPHYWVWAAALVPCFTALTIRSWRVGSRWGVVLSGIAAVTLMLATQARPFTVGDAANGLGSLPEQFESDGYPIAGMLILAATAVCLLGSHVDRTIEPNS